MFSREAFEAYVNSNGSIPFDLYAQNTDHWAWVTEYIPGIVISSAGGSFPFQAEGLIHNMPFYFRSEWGSASLKVGSENGDMPHLPETALYSAHTEYAEKTDEEDFVRLLIKLVPQLKKSPYLWRFQANKLHMLNDGSWGFTVGERTDEVAGWGFTPEEGYFAAREPKDYSSYPTVLTSLTPDIQRAMWKAQNPSRTPKNADPRNYPDIPPVFTVNI